MIKEKKKEIEATRKGGIHPKTLHGSNGLRDIKMDSKDAMNARYSSMSKGCSVHAAITGEGSVLGIGSISKSS